jgi:hypothetical protein
MESRKLLNSGPFCRWTRSSVSKVVSILVFILIKHNSHFKSVEKVLRISKCFKKEQTKIWRLLSKKSIKKYWKSSVQIQKALALFFWGLLKICHLKLSLEISPFKQKTGRKIIGSAFET